MTKPQFIFHYLLLNKYSYLFAILCIFIVNWLQVEIPRFIQLAVDLLSQTTRVAQEELVGNVKMVVALSLVMVLVRILSRMLALNPGRITEAQLKNDLFYRLNRLPSVFHQQYPTGKLISIINNDLNGIRAFYGIGFLQLFNILFALSLTPIWMWKISPSLTLYSVIIVVVAFAFFHLGFRRLRALRQKRMTHLQDLSAQLMTYLSGIDLIKNQQMGDWVSAEVSKLNEQLYDCTLEITRIQTFVMPVLDYANHFMKVLILGLGGYYLIQQDLTIGEITAFLSYSVLLALPLMHLGRIVTVFQMGMLSIDSVQMILNAPIPEVDQTRLDRATMDSLKGADLEVRNLSFQYPDNAGASEGEGVAEGVTNAETQPGQPVLRHLSFTIPHGRKVGILGSIGSGKSTLVNCLNHHLQVRPGTIFWGGVDLTRMSRRDWRQFVRTVTQDPYLFSDSIVENVRFGAQSEGFEAWSDVDQVLELSELSDDVGRFVDGDQTVVGEKGIMLSGGQKQRLSIARALLTPSDLIILDNVLSAVDYETERKILQGVFEHLKGQSVLVVSHRISALEMMDEILVLDQGEIIARGNHRQLLATSDYYRETWSLQQHEPQSAA